MWLMNESGVSVAVIVLTKDELVNLPGCLASLQGLDTQVTLVDSGSIDGTVGWAKAQGLTVLEHEWKNYASQLNWALDNIQTTCEWVMRLDADERLTPKLIREIKAALNVGQDVTGIVLRRRTYFLGKWIRHGGVYQIGRAHV